MPQALPGTRALRLFEAAARHLNFTRAAAELGLTPAAVSYQIKEIEDQTGLVLFTRTSRRIRLTPAGQVLFEAATEALDLLQRATVRARRLARGRAELRLSLDARFAANWLLPRLAGFRAGNPGIDLALDITDALRDFAGDDIDAAIRFGSGRYDGTRADRLFDAMVVPVCSPRLVQSGRAPRRPRDLIGHTLCHVEFRSDGLVWPNWPMWMAAAGIADFDASACLTFTDSAHVVQAVLDGDAIGLADLNLIKGDIRAGRLVRLFELGVGAGPGYGYHLVYPADGADDPRLAAFRGWLLAEVHAAAE